MFKLKTLLIVFLLAISYSKSLHVSISYSKSLHAFFT